MTKRSLSLLSVLFLLTLLFFNVNQVAAQEELVENGSFETGDFTDWTVVLNPEGSNGDWFIFEAGEFPPLVPSNGQYAAVTNQFAPSSQIIYQDIEIPSGDSVQCSVTIQYINEAVEFITGPSLNAFDGPNQQARVDIISTDAPLFTVAEDVLLNIYQTMPGDPNLLANTTLNFDLSVYAGSTVRFRAAEVDNQSNFNFAIDNVTCVAIGVENVPTLSEWGMFATAVLLGIIGFIVVQRRKATA